MGDVAGRAVTPAPPRTVAGTVVTRPRDTWRIARWTARGFALGARQGPVASRAYYSLLTVLYWPLLPVVLSVQLLLIRSSASRRYYMTVERDAVIAISVSPGTWHIEDHVSARPGTGRGRALRALVMPTLLEAADDAGVALEVTAVTDQLATAYGVDIPDLVDVGSARVRGRKLRRGPGGTGPAASTSFDEQDGCETGGAGERAMPASTALWRRGTPAPQQEASDSLRHQVRRTGESSEGARQEESR